MLDLITSSDSKYKTAKVHSAAVVFFTGILHVKPLWMFKTTVIIFWQSVSLDSVTYWNVQINKGEHCYNCFVPCILLLGSKTSSVIQNNQCKVCFLDVLLQLLLYISLNLWNNCEQCYSCCFSQAFHLLDLSNLYEV